MKKKILCYLRPFTKKQYTYFIKFVAPNQDIVHASEYRSVDKTGLPNFYYSFLENKKININMTKLSRSDVKDIIARCRLLRNIEKKAALKHLLAMYLAIDKVLNLVRPDFVTMQTVDAYIPDLFRFICKKKKIKFIGVVGTCIHNHFRITSRGEVTKNKKNNKSLTKQFLPIILKETYLPKYGKTIHKPQISIYKNWFIDFVGPFYWFVKRHLSGDKYNFHYWHRQLWSQQNFRIFPPIVKSNFNWEVKLNSSKKPSLYIPLSKIPEATIDYWCEDLKIIKYYETLEKLINKLNKHFSLFIKEHPAIVGSRPRNFYSKLIKDKRITIIPTETNSNYIVNKTDGVVIWSGTVGLDAILRGKPVFGLSRPFFASGKRFLEINLNTKIEKILKHILFCKKNIITKAEQEKTFGYVAQQMYKGRYNYHMNWSDKNQQDIKDVQQMARSCKHLFKI